MGDSVRSLLAPRDGTMSAGGSEARVSDAAGLARGVLRLLADLGFRGLMEFSLASGRRADVLALDSRGRVLIVEVKTSEADYRADAKWPEYLEFCDLFYFAVPVGFPQDRLPEDHGLMVVDRFGGAIVRPAVERKLSPPRRKALTLKFALKAAERLGEAPPQM